MSIELDNVSKGNVEDDPPSKQGGEEASEDEHSSSEEEGDSSEGSDGEIKAPAEDGNCDVCGNDQSWEDLPIILCDGCVAPCHTPTLWRAAALNVPTSKEAGSRSYL
jgi:hypothetical protein